MKRLQLGLFDNLSEQIAQCCPSDVPKHRLYLLSYKLVIWSIVLSVFHDFSLLRVVPNLKSTFSVLFEGKGCNYPLNLKQITQTRSGSLTLNSKTVGWDWNPQTYSAIESVGKSFVEDFEELAQASIDDWSFLGDVMPSTEMEEVRQDLLDLLPTILELRLVPLENNLNCGIVPNDRLPFDSSSRRVTGSYLTNSTLASTIAELSVWESCRAKIPHLSSFDNFISFVEHQPSQVVLEELISYLQSLTICDPAVGAGEFLVQAGNVILRWLGQLLLLADQRDLGKEKPAASLVEENLFGVDLSESAVHIATIRLLLWSMIKDSSSARVNIVRGNSLTIVEGWSDGAKDNKFTVHPFNWRETFPNIFDTENKGFQVILGNPPWGIGRNAMVSPVQKFFATAVGQYDSWGLFIELSVHYLIRDRGIVGFLIPNTFVNNPNYTALRKWLLKRGAPTHLINLGEGVFHQVTQPSMILVYHRHEDPPEPCYVMAEINLEENSIGEALKRHEKVPLEKLVALDDASFLIFAWDSHRFIKEIEEGAVALRTVVTNARGVELNKKGLVIECTCGAWNPPLGKNKQSKPCSSCGSLLESNKDHQRLIISQEPPSECWRPIYVGHHIHRFFNDPPWFIDPSGKGIAYKTAETYRGPKLLLAKTGHGISISLDPTDAYTLQVVYIFKPRKGQELAKNLSALMGVLNSAVMYTYFYRKKADPKRREFPHLTQGTFLSLPLKPLTTTNRETYLQVGQAAEKLSMIYQWVNKVRSVLDTIEENTPFVERVDVVEIFPKDIWEARTTGQFAFRLDQSTNLEIGYLMNNQFKVLGTSRIGNQQRTLCLFVVLVARKTALNRSGKTLKEFFGEVKQLKVLHDDGGSPLPPLITIRELLGNPPDQLSKVVNLELHLNTLVLDYYGINRQDVRKTLVYPP